MQHLILLRGLIRGQGHWAGFVNQLQQALQNTQVFCIDLAGNGKRYNEVSPDNISAAVDDIRQQIQKLHLSPPYHVLALSLGGMACLQYLHDSDDIGKALIINTSHGKLSPFWHRLKPKAMLALILGQFFPSIVLERCIYHLTVNNKDAYKRDQIISEWESLAKSNPVNFHNIIRQIKLSKSFTSQLNIQPDRVLLIGSQQDQLVNAQCSLRLAQTFNLPLQQHPKAGHDIAIDDADWLIQQIRHFFKK